MTKQKLEWRKPETIVERKFSCTQGGESPSGEESEARGFAHRCDRRPVVAVNDGCGARCAKHAPEGFKRHASKPAPFRRWSVAYEFVVPARLLLCGKVVLLLWAVPGQNTMADELAKELNRARVVLPKGKP